MQIQETPGRHSVAAERPGQTLRAALAAVALEASNSGLSMRTVAGAYRAPSKSLMRYLDGDAPLADIGYEDIRTMVRRCLAENLTACTIRQNYLRVLRLAFIQAGWDDEHNPVHLVLANMKRVLRVARPPLEFFTESEVHEVLAKVRAYKAPSGRRLRCQPRDLSVFELVAFTGIRSGEFARIDLERDVDFRARTLRVTSKVTTLPRIISMSDRVLRAVVTLAAARGSGPLIEGGEKRLNSICEGWKKRIQEPRLNLRNLRRSLATSLAERGVSVANIAKALGHTPGSPITLRYVGAVRSSLEDALRLIEHPDPQQRDDGQASR